MDGFATFVIWLEDIGYRGPCSQAQPIWSLTGMAEHAICVNLVADR